MTHDIRDALIDALRPVCVNPEVAADACLGVMEKWAADEPDEPTEEMIFAGWDVWTDTIDCGPLPSKNDVATVYKAMKKAR